MTSCRQMTAHTDWNIYVRFSSLHGCSFHSINNDVYLLRIVRLNTFNLLTCQKAQEDLV